MLHFQSLFHSVNKQSKQHSDYHAKLLHRRHGVTVQTVPFRQTKPQSKFKALILKNYNTWEVVLLKKKYAPENSTVCVKILPLLAHHIVWDVE